MWYKWRHSFGDPHCSEREIHMRNRFIVALAAVMMAVAGSAYAARTGEVEYADGIRGYLAQPDAPGKHPSVVLIHEWWGLNQDIREKAEAFADAGYNALAVDLYGGKVTNDPDMARQLAGTVSSDMPAGFANLRAAIDYLKTLDHADAGRIASVGWCFGGGWSYQIAKNDLGVKASVIYYGRFNPEDDLDRMRTTILGHFAENDSFIKLSDVESFQATLKALSDDHEVLIYPNTSHGFANPYNKRVYDADAARVAWERTIGFLEAHL